MTDIGAQLRAAREAQGRSLDDIASATRINIKYLASLEEGNPPNLPRTYIRAFIKGYAAEVGLDGEQMLARLDVVAAPPPTEAAQTENAPSPPKAEATRAKPAPAAQPQQEFAREKESPGPRSGQTRVLLLLIIVIVLGFSVSIIWLRQEHLSQQPQEISFSDAVKEQEAKLNPAPKPPDSTVQSPAQVAANVAGPAPVDSLSLEGIASDSVWVRVTSDKGTAAESILGPLGRKHWKAKNEFSVSVGNASAISFVLNGQKLGVLGAAKKPARNIIFSRETLSKRQVADVSRGGNAKP